ncbi:hypothetical protein KKF63_13300, partial [bacterium]|nr:hypothetical protein [bacterium]
LLENRETRGVGVSIMMDAQLFGGLQRALQFELMYERLVRTHDHWYPDYIDVVLNHSVVVGDETGFIGVRRLSIKEAYLLRLKGVREAAGPTTQSIALRILTNMAFRKDCPYETKERIAGVLLEYATDNMFKDIREAALEQLGRFRTTFYGDLDDAVNFALGADLRKKVEIQVALRTGKRGLTRLKELVEHKAYYSREALIAYRQKTADISGLDIMGIDIKGLSWTGSHITLAQLGYIRAHETPNPDTVSIDLTIDGASEAELLSYEGSLSRAAIVDTPLSKEAILTLMERGATVSYSLKHYWEYHFTEEELKRIYEAEDYKFFVDIFTHQSDTNTQRFCLTYLGHLFDPLDRDDFTTPALKAKKYHAEALKNFHPRGTYLLLYIACDEKQDYAVRELALREIKELDAEQIKKLGKTARGRYTDAIRLEAMIALGRNGSHKAVDELKVCLEDKPLPGSARAIHAITNHQVLSRLMDLTKHPHDTIQEAAYEAIGAIIAEHEISRELAQDTLSMSSDCVYLQILFDKTLKHQMRSNVLEAAINTYNIFLNKWKIHFTNDHLNAQFDENKNADALVTIVLENRSTSSSNQAMVILKTFAHLPVVEAALAKIVAESSQNNVLTAVLEGLTPETDTMLDALVSLVKRKSDYAQQAITVIGRSQNPKAVDTLVKLYELELRYDDATKLMKTLKGIATSNKPTTMTMQAANVLINFAKKQQERIFVDRENPDYDAITSVSELAQDNTLGLEIQQPAINFMWTTKRELCVPLARKVLMENAPVDFQQEAIYVMGQYYFYWETEDQRILEHVALNGVTEDLRKQAMETLNQHRPVGPESV